MKLAAIIPMQYDERNQEVCLSAARALCRPRRIEQGLPNGARKGKEDLQEGVNWFTLTVLKHRE